MAGKENSDLFSQLPSNDGSLPLDFDKNTGVSEPSRGETEKKTEASVPVPMKSQPKVEKADSQRRPTHHVPPPYKKTVQEAAPQEPKDNADIKARTEVQDKPAEKPVLEDVKDKDDAKPAAAVTKVEAVQAPVTAVVSAPAEVEPPVSSPALAAEAAPVASVVAEPVPVVQAPIIPAAAAQAEKTPEPAPVPKRSRQQKASRPPSAVAAEKQIESLIQPKTDPKPQVPDTKQQEMKTSDIQKQSIIADVKNEEGATVATVSRDRKVHPDPKAPKAEIQKQAKKTGEAEKFSADNATAGQLLQEGRVRTGLSIDQVSLSTKIKNTFIEALERDDFENLPASVYVNAYTRALCSLYNIDDTLVFSLLNKAKGKNLEYTVPEEVIQQLEMGKQVNLEQENKVKRILLIGFAACFALVACILIAYYFMHAGGNSSSPTASVKPVVYPETPAKTGINAGASAKTLEEDMEKKLIAPHVFTMTSLPLAER